MAMAWATFEMTWIVENDSESRHTAAEGAILPEWPWNSFSICIKVVTFRFLPLSMKDLRAFRRKRKWNSFSFSCQPATGPSIFRNLILRFGGLLSSTCITTWLQNVRLICAPQVCRRQWKCPCAGYDSVTFRFLQNETKLICFFVPATCWGKFGRRSVPTKPLSFIFFLLTSSAVSSLIFRAVQRISLLFCS